MKQLEVQIMGQSYLLGAPEGGEDRLREAVDRVDTAMCRIRDAGKIKARDRIAVLAALNLAFDLVERAQAGASRPEPMATPAATTATTAAFAGDSSDDPRLSALLQRLDNTLGGDGHLL